MHRPITSPQMTLPTIRIAGCKRGSLKVEHLATFKSCISAIQGRSFSASPESRGIAVLPQGRNLLVSQRLPMALDSSQLEKLTLRCARGRHRQQRQAQAVRERTLGYALPSRFKRSMRASGGLYTLTLCRNRLTTS